jgi:hypothetical protein
MVLTVSFALSLATGLVCHHRKATMPKHRGLLDASVGASGPHDFAVRRNTPFVFSARPRPPHPAPNVRDDRETPLVRRRDAAFMDLIWAEREGIYFRGGDWTGSISLIGFDKFGVGRKGRCVGQRVS